MSSQAVSDTQPEKQVVDEIVDVLEAAAGSDVAVVVKEGAEAVEAVKKAVGVVENVKKEGDDVLAAVKKGDVAGVVKEGAEFVERVGHLVTEKNRSALARFLDLLLCRHAPVAEMAETPAPPPSPVMTANPLVAPVVTAPLDLKKLPPIPESPAETPLLTQSVPPSEPPALLLEAVLEPKHPSSIEV